MKIILIIIAFFIVYESYGQTIWIQNRSVSNKIGKDTIEVIEKLVHAYFSNCEYKHYFQFSNKEFDKNLYLEHNDVIIDFFYHFYEGDYYGNVNILTVDKSSGVTRYQFYQNNIFLIPLNSDALVQNVIDISESILHWCKKYDYIH